MKYIFIALPFFFLGAKLIQNIFTKDPHKGAIVYSPEHMGDIEENSQFWEPIEEAPRKSFRYGPRLPDENEASTAEENLKPQQLILNYDQKVIVGNDKDFSKILDKFEHVLVSFVAPWCPYSKKLIPEFHKIANQLAKSHPKLALMRVDATENNELKEKYDIQKYPTILFFKKGDNKFVKYTGKRLPKAMSDWVKGQIKGTTTAKVTQ